MRQKKIRPAETQTASLIHTYTLCIQNNEKTYEIVTASSAVYGAELRLLSLLRSILAQLSLDVEFLDKEFHFRAAP